CCWAALRSDRFAFFHLAMNSCGVIRLPGIRVQGRSHRVAVIPADSWALLQGREAGCGASFIDAGLWANCPVLVAVTEAIACLGKDASDIDVLTIATTTCP